MKRTVAFIFWWGFCGLALAQDSSFPHGQEACTTVLEGKSFPTKFKTRGPLQRARWEQIDEVLVGLREDLEGIDCEIKFQEIFRTDKEELYIPLTNNMVRLVPEATLKGLPIFDQSGARLGDYEYRVSYDRRGGLYSVESYTLFYFQFKDTQGELQSSGNHLLLDDFLVPWSALADRVAMETSQDLPQ